LRLPRVLAAESAPALGRVTVSQLTVRSGPYTDRPEVGTIHMDDVVYIYGQIEGEALQRFNATWYNVGSGYVYSSFLQPVEEVHNPVEEVGSGFWGEITMPYVDARQVPYPDGPVTDRLYCHSVFWVQDSKEDFDGQTWYRLDSRRSRSFVYWAQADAVRRIPEDELTPISPGASKRIAVDLDQQLLTAYEGEVLVLEQRISSGLRYLSRGAAVDYRTRPGAYDVTSKQPTTHMIGGTAGIDSYNLPGVPWVIFFDYTGLAIHGAYWHNDFGRPRSHGCVHVPPRVGQWLYRWTSPHAGYDEDRLVVHTGGTSIVVQ
jgi:hypothetical protein